MNKDVIYIEPEDDITDIITKIENSKQKIVALVPPKKAGILRSVVNIKLIAKAGTASEKSVVLVTVDPSITKLAASAKLPVTKDLQTAPVIPEAEPDSSESSEVVDEDAKTAEEDADSGASENSENSDEFEDESEESEDSGDSDDESEEEAKDSEKSDKKSAKKAKKSKKEGKSTNKFVAWFKEHKKIAIPSGIGAILLIAVLIWAFVFAPAVTIILSINAEVGNFSKAVSFSTNLADEDIEAGVFHVDEKKFETIAETNFTATGEKNVGEKASGDVVVYGYFKEEGSLPIKSGTVFTINGLQFISTEDKSLYWGGGLSNLSKCDNKDNSSSLLASGCQVSTRIKVTAAEPGTKYNIARSNDGWDTVANVGVYSDQPMVGGTDETRTIVSQADIDKAKGELEAMNEAELKNKLYESIDQEHLMIIDASFIQTTSDAISTPNVGEEVGEGVTPTLKAVTTASVYVIDRTKIEECIAAGADLPDGYRIYEMEAPFIENFSRSDAGLTGKLKTSYSKGPSVTENDIVEMTKGKGLGVAQNDLKSIDGITSATIETSFPWVTSVPGNPNKITVELDIKKPETKSDTKTTENAEE